MFKSHLRVRGKNFTRLGDEAEDISSSILKKLFFDTYFHTGLNNYPQFWSRDFGMMVPSLLKLGYKKEVLSTLSYALKHYAEFGEITTQISPKGKPINFPNRIAPDSLAYLFLSLRLAKADGLVKKYWKFLQSQLNIYTELILNENGLVKRHTHFSSMRDHSVRDASCYDTVMMAVTKREAKLLGFTWNAKNVNYEKVLKEKYWTGKFFRDNLSEKKLSADANIYPFWHDIIKSPQMRKSAIKSMQQAKLDKPFPIKYVKNKKLKGEMIVAEWLVNDWESDSIWPMSGLPYIEVLNHVDKNKATLHLNQYKELIEKYGTFIEVYNNKGVPYSSFVFSSDEGMIWCALWLKLWKEIKE